jgi:hypothetical protein
MSRISHLGRRAVALAAAALLALGWAGPATAQANAVKAPTQDDQVILQLQVKTFRLRNELRGYQLADGGVCVDLGDVILALDLPVRLDKKSRRATGWLFREDQTFTLDRDKNTVQIVNNEQAVRPGDIYDTPEGWCVDTRTLARWLGATLTPNLFEAVLQLDSKTPLPFIEAIERKSRAARLQGQKTFNLADLPQASVPYRAWRTPSVDAIVELGFVRGEGGQGTTLRGRYQVYASGEIAGASVDARLASDAAGAPDTLRVRAFRNDPDGHMLGPLKATQAAVGDVELYSGNLAGAGGIGRGAFVSNRPLNRSNTFGKTILRGELPIGWDAELYRNGQLLAFESDRSDGRYEFDVDLVYGNNDLEVVLYGPQGQVRREKQTIPVGYGAVAPGRLEYWAGVIQRNHDLINFHDPPGSLDGGWQYGFGTQYGLDKRTVVGATAESLFYRGRRRNYGELDVQRALGPMVLDLTAAQEFGAGRAYRATALGRMGKLNITAETFFLDGDFSSGQIPDGERSEQNFEIENIFGSKRVILPVAVGFKRTVRADGQKVNEWLARASLILPRLSLTAALTKKSGSDLATDDRGTRLEMLANTRLLGLSLRANASYRLSGPQKGLASAQLTLEKALTERSDLRVDVRYDATQDLTSVEAAYLRQFRRLALNVGATADSLGGLGANVGVTFSFSRDPFGDGLRFSNTKLAQRGEAAVSVFVDKNGDGVRSPGEQPLAGVNITAGQYGSSEPTDKNGHAMVEDLNPYEKVAIGVDESSLPDPFLVPVRKAIVITPRPGVPAKLEIAIAPTGEVEGEVHGAEDVAKAGVELELVDSSGRVAATTLTEYDGYFLFEQVPYGQYSVRLSAGSARALGTARDTGKTADLSEEKSDVDLGVIRLRPSQVAQSSLMAGPPAALSP